MKNEAVVLDLRRRIVSGEFPAGTQLPLRQELTGQYQVSTVVFQKCVTQLVREGFLESRGVKGTWVVPFPPHIFRVGVLVPAPASERRDWDSCWKAFELSIGRLKSAGTPYSFEFYYNITDEANLDQSEEWQRLCQDIELARISGLIVLKNLFRPELLNRLEQVPTIFLGEHEYLSANLFSVDFDYHRQIDLALEFLGERGCRSVAVLLNTTFEYKYYYEIERLFQRHGLAFRPSRLQAACLCPDAQIWLGQTVRLLFDPNQSERPDGLVVLNENFLHPLLGALDEMGLQAGRDLEIISHGNQPKERNEYLRVHRIWVNCGRLLEKALEVLRECRENGGWTGPLGVPGLLQVEAAKLTFSDECTQPVAVTG